MKVIPETHRATKLDINVFWFINYLIDIISIIPLHYSKMGFVNITFKSLILRNGGCMVYTWIEAHTRLLLVCSNIGANLIFLLEIH